MIMFNKDFLRAFSKDKSYFFLLIVFAIIPIVFSASTVLFFQEKLEYIAKDNFYSMVLFYIITMFTMAFALTPTTLVAVVSGFYFSWHGLLGVLIAYPFAAVIGLLFGRLLMRALTNRDYFESQTLRSFYDNLAVSQLPMLIFCRLSPILPFAMTNIALSRMKINWKEYVIGTLIGMFPRTLLFFLVGKNTKDIWMFINDPGKGGLHTLLLPVFILISVIGLSIIMNNAIKRMRHDSRIY